MATKRSYREALIGEVIIFDKDDDKETSVISPSFMSNQIDIISLDGLEGEPTTPTGGEYRIFAKTDSESGYKLVAVNGIIPAMKTGGEQLADGEQIGATFIGLPTQIKIIPVGVTGAIAYRVLVKQNSEQLPTLPDQIFQSFSDINGIQSLNVNITNPGFNDLPSQIRTLKSQNDAILNQLRLVNLKLESMSDSGTNINDIEG